ncbi:MAG: hypothetical protein DRJ03_20545 [Chloroflexi bacterium]|nr:MAG: hypothetical protein B6I35_03965 [Anaerolineaceae bacterium 4572_32.2]RLC76015.1 MAG: hypothetical protein DRI81_10850 [Chloroflexota bacterium]RLC81157.1 MAG: hypothetical protein DRJ03_20545 [Chloroflexota bacterium]HEY73353.1 hypothetical protein [Thermoflexia bacterium]
MPDKTLSSCLILLLLFSASHLIHAEGLPTPLQPGSDPAPVTFSLVIHENGTWEGEALFSHVSLLREKTLDAQAQQEAVAIFGNHGVRYNLDEKEDGSYTFYLTGDDAQEIVELALSAGHAVKRLDGPVALDIGGSIRTGQEMALTLTANPSTGYSWEMEAQAGSAISQINDVETHQVTQGLGTPARQIIRLKTADTGQTALRLLYRRPWQADLAPAMVVSIQATGLNLAEICAALSAPPPPPVPINTLGIQAEALQQPTFLSSTQTLPSAYNWCDANGGCTSIKNQASCGSCWAFATVGPLEAHLQAASQTTDLSEQYLVSCNERDYDCSGGWFAHDYHEWDKLPSEPAAGAVLESAFPYAASDIACAGPYTHPHKIADWRYVESSSSTPSVDAIKQAIYDHGPVAAAICVNSTFQGYGGGVFNPSATCNGINHAIVLVGWNDAEQTWTLRNSWGADWGEGGYMRIRYGVYQVGYAANYVVYTSSTPFVATDWVYLPLALRDFETTLTYDLANGNFENGQDGSWTESSSKGWDLITNASDLHISPHGGNWAVWLGGDNDEIAALSQQVTIPSSAATLNYWYWISSEDACGFDYAYVRFGTTMLKSYNLCESNNTSGWTSQQIDVTGWQSQTVELNFAIETDWILNSNFFLDDVSVSTIATPLALPISPALSGKPATGATIPKGTQ